ncbi:MAG: hypothetical protein ACK5AK_12050 [Gemmatimonas sp.]
MRQPPASSRTGGASGMLTANGAKVKAGALVRPDTVEVGDSFTYVVTVVVPANARVEWPAIQDTAAVVAMREPVTVIDEGTKLGARRERVEYTLTAWDVGSLPLGMPDAVVRYGQTTLRVPLGDAKVFVRSVLLGDSTQHVPKPARDLFERMVPWWQRSWPALLVLVAIGMLWRLWRQRVRARTLAARTPGLDAYERAVHEFDRLDRVGLADAGEAGRYVAIALDVMRLYLVQRVSGALRSLTSDEIIEVLANDARIPHGRVASLLADVDGIKFAARPVSPSRARELAAAARGIVEEIEQRERARLAAEEAARQAAAAPAAREQQDAEERARRASRAPRGPRSGAGAS